uniref:(northern house mosquito) hypothetical protein n=1 Tax=Culex pipiens TaxID=7175 RepID=A0A8D8FYK7_CULPI
MKDLILLTKVLVQGRCRDRRPPRCSCGTVRRPVGSGPETRVRICGPGSSTLPGGIARSPIAGHSLHGHEATKHVVPTAASPIAPLIITTCTRAPRAREHKTDQPLTTNEAETRTAAAALPPPKLLYQVRSTHFYS